MVHPADFRNAHDRHWCDAELLFQRGRWANADQLYGYSAECGLKAVMVAHTGSPIDPGYKRHFPALWGTFLSFVDGPSIAEQLRGLPQANPFAGWSQDNRYAASGHFNAKTVTPHRKAARLIRDFYERLRVIGYA